MQQLYLKYTRWRAAGDVSAAKSRSSVETVAAAKRASGAEAEAAAEVEAAAVAKAAVEQQMQPQSFTHSGVEEPYAPQLDSRYLDTDAACCVPVMLNHTASELPS